MGAEPLSGSTPITFTEIFNEIFPFYLSIGMTYEQFWYKDASLVIPYRKAHELKRKQDNHDLWLQGVYFSNAIASCFSKDAKYPTEPLPATNKDFQAFKEREQQAKIEKMKAYMMSQVMLSEAQHKESENECQQQ